MKLVVKRIIVDMFHILFRVCIGCFKLAGIRILRDKAIHTVEDDLDFSNPLNFEAPVKHKCISEPQYFLQFVFWLLSASIALLEILQKNIMIEKWRQSPFDFIQKWGLWGYDIYIHALSFIKEIFLERVKDNFWANLLRIPVTVKVVMACV